MLLLAALPRSGQSQTYEGRELVRASLVADVTAIVPGKPFTVGLLLRMVPNWHTYWKFPGDAGIATEIKWKLPDGWKAGEIQWPIPLKLNEPGDIQIYGYHDEVLLLQEITPPASLTGPAANLSAEANWLVCEKICIPGSAKLQLELPVAAQNAPANEDLFARYRRSLPQAWPEGKIASASWKRSGSELSLTVTSAALANYPVVDFFRFLRAPWSSAIRKRSAPLTGKSRFACLSKPRMKNCRRSAESSSSDRTRMARVATRGCSLATPQFRLPAFPRRPRAHSRNFSSSVFSAVSFLI